MVAVPAVMPVTTPAAMVATASLLLLHEPPATVAVSVVVLPVQTVAVPLTVPGVAETVTLRVVLQPATK